MSGRYLNLQIYGRVEIQCDNCFMFWVQLVEGKDERTTVNIGGQDSALRTI